MNPETPIIRERILAVLRQHDILTTAQVASESGWVFESVSHSSAHQYGVDGFYHGRVNDGVVRLVSCDGERCLLLRNLAFDQTVLRNLNALERAGAVTKVKFPGVKAASWMLTTAARAEVVEADELEECWNLPSPRRG